ncbi:MAG: hypothetical protein AAF585_23755, partial [Verrucomicrobiota bacterium]
MVDRYTGVGCGLTNAQCDEVVRHLRQCALEERLEEAFRMELFRKPEELRDAANFLRALHFLNGLEKDIFEDYIGLLNLKYNAMIGKRPGYSEFWRWHHWIGAEHHPYIP